MAWTIVERPDSVKTMCAAPPGASVAPSTATPTLARDKAGGSLAPSPVIAHRRCTYLDDNSTGHTFLKAFQFPGVLFSISNFTAFVERFEIQ